MTSLTNELYAIFMCHLLAGSEESLKYTKMLLEDVKKAPKGEGLHILWMHMMPFLQEPVKDVFNYSQNVHIRACDFVADGFSGCRPRILMRPLRKKWSTAFTTEV